MGKAKDKKRRQERRAVRKALTTGSNLPQHKEESYAAKDTTQ